MGFRLITDVGGGYDDYPEDDSSYSFNAEGLLIVNGRGIRRTYSPLAWQYIEEDTRPVSHDATTEPRKSGTGRKRRASPTDQ